jgi:tripartite-type tricarboxylate transporter receptor subunit TctC
MKPWSAASAALLAAALLALPAQVALPAQADEVADFYKGKTITVTAASGVGGGYGVYAMLIREHISKYIPGNPNVIVNYNPGGGGVVAADYHFNVAPKDGTAILAPLQSTPTLQLVGRVGIRYDASKFHWIGRAAETTSGFVVHRKVAASFDALIARQEETVVGVTQTGAPNHIQAALMGYCPSARIKLVSGYKGSPPLALAFQRNEVDGLALPLDSLRLVYPDILKEAMLAQSGLARSRDFPDVPLTVELCKDPDKLKIVEFFQVQEEMGRSYALPPGTPAARVAALRKAFDAVMKDPALLALAKQRRLDINPLSGDALQTLVERHIATDDATVKIAKQAVGLQ